MCTCLYRLTSLQSCTIIVSSRDFLFVLPEGIGRLCLENLGLYLKDSRVSCKCVLIRGNGDVQYSFSETDMRRSTFKVHSVSNTGLTCSNRPMLGCGGLGSWNFKMLQLNQ